MRRQPKCELLNGFKAEVVPLNDAVPNDSKVHEARGRVRRSKRNQQIGRGAGEVASVKGQHRRVRKTESGTPGHAGKHARDGVGNKNWYKTHKTGIKWLTGEWGVGEEVAAGIKDACGKERKGRRAGVGRRICNQRGMWKRVWEEGDEGFFDLHFEDLPQTVYGHSSNLNKLLIKVSTLAWRGFHGRV